MRKLRRKNIEFLQIVGLKSTYILLKIGDMCILELNETMYVEEI
jgi:hypothetical protein